MIAIINWIIFFASAVGSFLLMKNTNMKRSLDVDSASLTKSEKNQVWIYTLLNPLATNLILYYGWRKVFPGKAKEVNRITIPVFIAYIIIGIILLASGLVEIRQG